LPLSVEHHLPRAGQEACSTPEESREDEDEMPVHEIRWMAEPASPRSPLIDSFAGTPVVKTILAGGGFNWVLIDVEHGQITDKDYFEVSCRLLVAVPPGFTSSCKTAFFQFPP